RNLFSGAALSQSDGGSGDGGRQSSRRQNKGVTGRRLLRQGTSARGRPHDARHVSRRSQGAERIQGKMGLLQGSPPHSGRRGGPAAERKQVLARQEIRASAVRFLSIATVEFYFESPSVSARKQTKVTREAQGLMSGFDAPRRYMG